MSQVPTPEATPTLPSGPFVGRETFRQLVRDALAAAAREGWPELRLCDASFVDWPLGERQVLESLTAWVRQGGERRLVLLARCYDEVPRQHARFVPWRQQWDHRIDCRARADADPDDLPSALWSAGWCLERLDPRRASGVSGAEPERCQRLRQALDEELKRARPGFAATTLGL
jgi:hypothetical protein